MITHVNKNYIRSQLNYTHFRRAQHPLYLWPAGSGLYNIKKNFKKTSKNESEGSKTFATHDFTVFCFQMIGVLSSHSSNKVKRGGGEAEQNALLNIKV